jgi:hypothetical protein
MRNEEIADALRPAPSSPPREGAEVVVLRVAEDVVVMDARDGQVVRCPAGHYARPWNDVG